MIPSSALSETSNIASTAEADVSGRESAKADPARILAERVKQLFAQLPLAVCAILVLSAVTTFEMYQPRLQELVLFWWIVVAVVSAAHIGLFIAYRQSSNSELTPQAWHRRMGIAALAGGTTWGFAAAVFFPAHTEEQQVFLAFMLAGVMAGGVPIYAASWRVYALHAAGVVVPFTYVLAAFGKTSFTALAVLVPFFYAANVLVAYRVNHVFSEGYRLRHAYGHLTGDYTSLNQRLEEQIAELMDAHREVDASGRKLALFAERAPIAVFEMDRNATVLEMNPVAENIFGYPAIELTGRNLLRTLIPADDPTMGSDWWAEFIRKGEPVTGLRVQCLRRDGLEISCEFSLTPLVNDVGDLLSVIAQGRDVTQQLEAERLKKEFTSTLSHELRTPLTSIIGSLQLVNSGVLGDPGKDLTELTVIAERNAERLLDLINDLLDIEKIESGKIDLHPEVLALNELVREAITLNRAYADRFQVRYEAPKELPSAQVNVDRKRLFQVVTNLLSNAAKFSPEGGVVNLTMEDRGDSVYVGISDRGPGIPENFRHRIFSRFAQADSATTRQKGGTGLGLSISRRLVELMGGKIGFADREGGGTTFWFEIPKHST